MEEAFETQKLLDRAASGDAGALDQLLVRHRPRLERMVALRMDPRLRRRFDPPDVVQGAMAHAWKRLPEYQRSQDMPFFLWLRFLTLQEILELERRHLDAQARDVRREEPRDRGAPRHGSESLADHLAQSATGPMQHAARQELRDKVLEALEVLGPQDREALLLRHYEQLTNAELACELGISEAASSKRYIRALQRLERELRLRNVRLEDFTR